MRTIRQHLTSTKIAAILAVFLAAGGAAWAASSTGGTIHACYKRHGGALRIAGRCKHGEKPLSWNQIGATGAKGAKGSTGPRGLAGAQGTAGPAGPSDVFASGRSLETLATSAFASYGSVSVPAGSYLIEAKATFIPETKPSGTMNCALAPGISFTTPWDAATASGEPGVGRGLSLIGAKTFTTAQTIELVCKASLGTGKIEDAHLIAIKTALLHGELPVH